MRREGLGSSRAGGHPLREAQAPVARRAVELQFYTSAAAVAMLLPAWVFMVSVGVALLGAWPPLSSAVREWDR